MMKGIFIMLLLMALGLGFILAGIKDMFEKIPMGGSDD